MATSCTLRWPFWAVAFIFTTILSSVYAKGSAWNGHTTPGSTKPTYFTPFYVPPGAKSYNSSSPLIHYTGEWVDTISDAYVQRRSTTAVNAAFTFTFTGTGIEWYGNRDIRHGVSDVYIDGILVERVDAYSPHNSPLRQQCKFWHFGLPYRKHTMKIVNTAKRPGSKTPTMCDICALVVTRGVDPDSQSNVLSPAVGVRPLFFESQMNSLPSSKWSIVQEGSTGVHAMQLAIISSSHALVVDKVEHNPLTISGHPAWAALYNLDNHKVKPLGMQSNSFCAGGTFLSNGTMINVGGNPVVGNHTSAANFGDVDGLQAIRLFHPCDTPNVDDCEMYENHSQIRMASPRWYSSAIRIQDGSAIIMGGSKRGGWMNNGTVNNPTVEYFPPKSIHGSKGLPIHVPFFVDTLNSNLFPIAFLLPDGKIFMAANQDTMIYDWETNTEQRLPRIPNGVRVTYPMAGTGLLLPLSPQNDYTPEVLLCGGSVIDDHKAGHEISSQDPASAQCSRMVLSVNGIAAGWKTEQMPEARTMPDAVLLPTGKVLIINGAGSGISGYGNVKDQVGVSNAANPVLTPVLYDPIAPLGQRFLSAGMPTSQIPRLYHSVATLTPNGDVMVAGSNPNLDRSEVEYGTEYRVEWFKPPYMTMVRPQIIECTTRLEYGQESILKVKLGGGPTEVALMDLGYVTHTVHLNSRLVYLEVSRDGNTLKVRSPPNGKVYPPGPGWLYVIVDGVCSKGTMVMVGDGRGPPVDEEASRNVLEHTAIDQHEQSKGYEDSGGG